MQNRREFLKYFAAGAAGVAVFPRLAFGGSDAWTTEYPQILSRIRPPKFPKKDFNITKFGAKAGVENDSSAAIAEAIDACSKAGGGRDYRADGRISHLGGAFEIERKSLYFKRGDAEVFDRCFEVSDGFYSVGRNGMHERFAFHICF